MPLILGWTIHGVLLYNTSEDPEKEYQAILQALDTTGAGDAFNGGLLTALSEGKDLWEAAVFANALAALSVQKLGTTVSMPLRKEIDAFLAEHK